MKSYTVTGAHNSALTLLCAQVFKFGHGYRLSETKHCDFIYCFCLFLQYLPEKIKEQHEKLKDEMMGVFVYMFECI